jgi:hypothetical protein
MFASSNAVKSEGGLFDNDGRRPREMQNTEKFSRGAIDVFHDGTWTGLETGRDHQRIERSHGMVRRDISRLIVPMQASGNHALRSINGNRRPLRQRAQKRP